MRLLTVLFLLQGCFVQAANLTYEGLFSFSRRDLEESIAGRLDYIRKREATVYRADDAAYLIEAYLRSHGLPDATVTGVVVSPKEIRLAIDEGLAQFVGPLTVIGSPKVEEIQNQFRAPFPESGKKRAFQPAGVESGLARVRDLMHADGYWKASVTSVQGQRNAQNEIPFTLKVTLGSLFTLAPPSLKSPVPPSTALQDKLQRVTGKHATAENINSVRNTIFESYRRRGYREISVAMSREFTNNQLRLFFTLIPGKKFTVRSLNSEGLVRTQKNRVTNRFTGTIGQNYDENLLNEKIKKLLASGAFDSIRLESLQGPNNTIDVTLHLKEAKARGYSFALGYGSIEGYVLGARYYDRNLGGRLWNLSAGLELTGLGWLGEASLSNPFFLNRELNLANRAFLISRDFDHYRKLQSGIGTELSWKKGKHYLAALGFEISHTSVSSPLPDDLIGPDDYLVNRLTFRQLYDRRNDPALPSDGWFARLENALGFATGDGGIGFFETRAQVSYYQTLGEKNGLSLGLRGGVILPSAQDEDLPIDLRRFLGGANTIRSFPELEMGPTFEGRALGGTSWWIANAEFSRALAGPVKGLIFLDAANLDSETDLAAGLGVRIELPVGPLRLEYGRSLSRDPGEPSGAFHFAIGATF